MLYSNNCIASPANVNIPKRLAEAAKKNGRRLNERKAKGIRLAKIYYAEADALQSKKPELEAVAKALRKRAGRVVGCCSHRDVAVNAEGYGYTTYTHRCRDRNCTECQRVRAFVLQEKIREITPSLIEQTAETDGLIFGTLTIKNPKIEELKAYLKLMSRAFARLMTRKKLKGVVRGGFRCFETTRGTIKGYCHPHIHFLLQIKKSYFNNKGPHYMRSEEWAEEWTKCVEAEAKKAGLPFNRDDYPDGRAFVKILRVQTAESAKSKGGKRQYATIADLKDSDSVVNYVLKYTAKEDEDSAKSLVKADEWFVEYDKQIKGIRAISFFGIYKELIAELPPRVYDEEEEKIRLEVGGAEKFYSALWDDASGYIAIDQTMQNALDKKRLNVVNSIKNTLKVQIENQNILLHLMLKTLKNQDYYKTDEFINRLNEVKNRTLKTLQRLQKTGEMTPDAISGGFVDVWGCLFRKELFENIQNLLTEEELNYYIQLNNESVELIQTEDFDIF